MSSPIAELTQTVSENIIPLSPSDTIESLISKVAQEMDVSSTTLYNVAQSESGLNPDPPGHNDGGLAAGLVQIHYKTWGFTKEQALDPEFSLRFLAKHLKAGDAWKYWTSLNCYTFVDTKFHFTLPRMEDLEPNGALRVGAVALFTYSNRVRHFAIVTSVQKSTFTVQEANFTAGVIGMRTVEKDDTHLDGFWYA